MEEKTKTYYIVAFSAMLGYYIGKVADSAVNLYFKELNQLISIFSNIIYTRHFNI